MMNPYEKIVGLDWYHSVPLPDGSFTPGETKHASTAKAEAEVFGITPELMKNCWVLDVGCWDGIHSWWALEYGANTVWSFDCKPLPTLKVLKEIREYHDLNCAGWRFDTREGNTVEKLPFDSEQFNVVLFFGVFYHIEDPMAGFRECVRVCKPGGTILAHGAMCDIINKPNEDIAWYNAKDLGVPGVGAKWYPTDGAVHYALKAFGCGETELVNRLPNRSRATFKGVKES